MSCLRNEQGCRALWHVGQAILGMGGSLCSKGRVCTCKFFFVESTRKNLRERAYKCTVLLKTISTCMSWTCHSQMKVHLRKALTYLAREAIVSVEHQSSPNATNASPTSVNGYERIHTKRRIDHQHDHMERWTGEPARAKAQHAVRALSTHGVYFLWQKINSDGHTNNMEKLAVRASSPYR
ncbi:hypothetical protein K431DRAFT_37180 [Polychaeton citri CBS 116435]|uniref:Uncharacterized protein n=1 Tax=Polychaeton citri CBS 116435 TaxID=1314669 RepID=A0A9P4USE2_9PEZI|nr:hypothetical protein K431DRAFT_37180 [Polychaeton citri CBS 116435]